MNLIYGSIVVFLVLLPGIIFRKSYLASVFSRRLLGNKAFDDIMWAIMPGILLHSISGIIIPLITNYQFELEIIGKFVSANTDEKIISAVFKNISTNFAPIIYYNIIICIIAYALGNLTRLYVRKWKLDIKMRAFRFTNKWHYILSGESLMFPSQLRIDDINEIDYISIDVLSKTISGSNIIYKGVFYNYYLSNDGGLESIVLEIPRRRFLENSTPKDKNKDANDKKKKNSKGDEEEYTEIPSTKFIIPFHNIENINIAFFRLIDNNHVNSR